LLAARHSPLATTFHNPFLSVTSTPAFVNPIVSDAYRIWRTKGNLPSPRIHDLQ